MKYKPLRYIPVRTGDSLNIGEYPNIHKSGSLSGMRKLYWRCNQYQVQSGNYIYDVPEFIYNQANIK